MITLHLRLARWLRRVCTTHDMVVVVMIVDDVIVDVVVVDCPFPSVTKLHAPPISVPCSPPPHGIQRTFARWSASRSLDSQMLIDVGY